MDILSLFHKTFVNYAIFTNIAFFFHNVKITRQAFSGYVCVHVYSSSSWVMIKRIRFGWKKTSWDFHIIIIQCQQSTNPIRGLNTWWWTIERNERAHGQFVLYEIAHLISLWHSIVDNNFWRINSCSSALCPQFFFDVMHNALHNLIVHSTMVDCLLSEISGKNHPVKVHLSAISWCNKNNSQISYPSKNVRNSTKWQPTSFERNPFSTLCMTCSRVIFDKLIVDFDQYWWCWKGCHCNDDNLKQKCDKIFNCALLYEYWYMKNNFFIGRKRHKRLFQLFNF
jgi:hypothetical protein